MTDLIRWALSLIFPPKGCRRAAAQPQEAAETAAETTTQLRIIRPRCSEPLYFVDHLPLVRPYVVAHEQQQRRTALYLATLGIDADAHVIGGVA